MFAAFVITQKIILFLRFTEIFLVGLQWNVWKSIYVEINFVHTKYLYSMFFSFCTLLYLRLTISSTLCFILQKNVTLGLSQHIVKSRKSKKYCNHFKEAKNVRNQSEILLLYFINSYLHAVCTMHRRLHASSS